MDTTPTTIITPSLSWGSIPPRGFQKRAARLVFAVPGEVYGTLLPLPDLSLKGLTDFPFPPQSTINSKVGLASYFSKDLPMDRRCWWSPLASIPSFPTFRHQPQGNRTVFRQPIGNRTYQGSSISCTHETHRHTISFYSLDHRKWILTPYLLPHRRYGRQHTHQGTPFPESQALHEGTRTLEGECWIWASKLFRALVRSVAVGPSNVSYLFHISSYLAYFI